eukprot:IDg19992t1
MTKEDVLVSREVIFDERPSKDAIIADLKEPDQEGEHDKDPSTDYDPTLEKDKGPTDSTETLSPESAQSSSLSPSAFNKPSDLPRISTRTRKKPGEWWKASSLLTTTPESTLSYTAATEGENSKKWLPAIK